MSAQMSADIYESRLATAEQNLEDHALCMEAVLAREVQVLQAKHRLQLQVSP